tara:strand:- start:302 stop:583 length:282 start_codon:yes stop_codon:yes gene_type:complete
MKNSNIKKIRRKLDSLDDKLLNLVKRRSKLVDKILKNKNRRNQIVDKKRIKTIIKRIKRKSLKKKIDPKLTENIWRTMIRSFINYEYRNFKKR